MKTGTEVLLVDDNPADIDLTQETLAQSKQLFHVSAVSDGSEAICFLRQQGKFRNAPSPDLVLLDLNLPRKDGREVLATIKADPLLQRIPILVFTTSDAASDVIRSYELGANCYLRKPGNLPDFIALVQLLEKFWFDCVILPRKEQQ
jgi:two-component system, chemotaxis family, response regulator Rcp1